MGFIKFKFERFSVVSWNHHLGDLSADIRVESSRKIDQASAGSLLYNRGNLQCVKFAMISREISTDKSCFEILEKYHQIMKLIFCCPKPRNQLKISGRLKSSQFSNFQCHFLNWKMTIFFFQRRTENQLDTISIWFINHEQEDEHKQFRKWHKRQFD